MKILVISSRLPHAQVISGHQIVHQRVRRLSERGHEIGLACLTTGDDDQHIGSLRGLVREIETRPLRGNFACRTCDAVLSTRPSRFRACYSPALLRCVGDMVERTHYDVALAEFGLMGQYLHHNPYLPAVRKVVSVDHCHTLSCRKALDLLKHSPRVVSEWISLQRLQRYEFNMYRSADHTIVLSPEERYGVLSYAPDLRVTVIPSGVDTEYFKPDPAAVREEAVVITGYYDDVANRDAVLWFSRTVWPLLRQRHPHLTFYVVGPNPSRAMLDLAHRDPGIVVTGWVEDIRPYLARAKVFVCPNRLGSGMRGKILQAMASGVPVAATTLGAEGIPVQIGDTGFIADTPAIMAQHISLLLGDDALRNAIACNARSMVVERFSWDRSIDMLESVLHEVVGR
jgi:glycosyltransferase involved in cell wall biosynthesis